MAGNFSWKLWYNSQDLLIIAFLIGMLPLVLQLPQTGISVIRLVVVLPFILFIPGYLILALAYPRIGDLRFVERAALSLALSGGTVALTGYAFHFLPSGLELSTLGTFYSVLSTLLVIAVMVRRATLTGAEVFGIDVIGMAVHSFGIAFGESRPKKEKLFTVFLILSVLLTGITSLHVVASNEREETYTEFYILGPRGRVDEYPVTIPVGEAQDLIIGIRNMEGRDMNYTLEVYLTSFMAENALFESTVSPFDAVSTTSLLLEDGETEEWEYTFSIDDSRYSRMHLLLFTEEIPPQSVRGWDRVDASYRNLDLWLNVTS